MCKPTPEDGSPPLSCCPPVVTLTQVPEHGGQFPESFPVFSSWFCFPTPVSSHLLQTVTASESPAYPGARPALTARLRLINPEPSTRGHVRALSETASLQNGDSKSYHFCNPLSPPGTSDRGLGSTGARPGPAHAPLSPRAPTLSVSPNKATLPRQGASKD